MINKIAFLGAGNMSGAIIEGMIDAGFKAEKIWATNRSAARSDYWASKGVNATSNNIEAISNAEVVILGVKPAQIDELLVDIAPHLNGDTIVISVAAGVPMSNFQRRLPHHAIVRTMPNTPCLVKQGVVGVFYGSGCDQFVETVVNEIFSPVALVHTCAQEDEIDTVIAVAGSAPAYFFLFMEGIIDAGMKMGLSAEDAAAMVTRTALGASIMASQGDIAPAQLRRNVTSPGGTTHEAITRFQNEGLADIVDKAMSDCVNRAKSMADELRLDK